MKSSIVILILRDKKYYCVVTAHESLDVCIFARFEVNCEVMLLRSFAIFK